MIRLIVVAVFAVCLANRPEPADAAERPNLLIILADDLGYSDLGCYGGEIATPHLDSLAANGLQFTQFYNTARCWPSRAALLTGYYAQQVRRDTLAGIPSGGRGVRPAWAPLLPNLLKSAGYRSYHSGKWHIDGMPIENGFDRSYYLRDQGRFFNPDTHWEDDQKLPPVEAGTNYYGTTAIAEHALKCLKDHARIHPDRPFFHYLAFTAPHFPLHALPEDIAKYEETYRAGWDVNRAARWRRIQDLGLVQASLSEVEPDVGPPYHFPDALEILGAGEINRPLPWNELTAAQQEFQAAKMALHAAMVDRIDQEIGRVLAQLRAMEAFENTLIVFLSDNGASAEIMVRADGHDPAAAPGSAKSYLCLGPGWSTSSNTPFRRHKTWVHEGGISTPCVVHWPAGISARGELRHQPGHLIDIVPTILEIAGIERPAVWNDIEIPAPPGRSLVPALARDGTVTHETLWWQHEGNRAIRIGPWKLVAAGEDAPWELFRIDEDRTETNNLADAHPEIVERLARTWKQTLDGFRELALRDLPDSAPPARKRSR